MKDKPTIFSLDLLENYENFELLFLGRHSSQSKFFSDVESIIRKYGDEFIAYYDDDVNPDYLGASNLIIFIGEKLCNLGYEHISPISYSINGTSIIKNDSENLGIKKMVGNKLFKKILAHNKKVDKSIGIND